MTSVSSGPVAAQVAHARRGRQAVAADALEEAAPGRLHARRRRRRAAAAPAATGRSAARRATTSPTSDDRAAQRVLDVGEAALERAVEGPDQRRRQRLRGAVAARVGGAFMARLPRSAPERAGRRSASRSRPTGFGPWSPAPCTWPLCASQLRSVSTRDRPWSTARCRAVGAVGGDVPLVRAAASRSAGMRWRAPRRAPRAQRGQLVERRCRRSGSSACRSCRRASRCSRQRRASKTCSQARARGAVAVAVRQAARGSPRRRRATARFGCGRRQAPAHDGRSRARRIAAPTPRSDSTRCGRRSCGLAVGGGGQRGHHAGDAERAGPRMALAPAFGDDVDDRAAAALLPVVVAARAGRRRRRRSGARSPRRAPPAASAACGAPSWPPTGSLISRP